MALLGTDWQDRLQTWADGHEVSRVTGPCPGLLRHFLSGIASKNAVACGWCSAQWVAGVSSTSMSAGRLKHTSSHLDPHGRTPSLAELCCSLCLPGDDGFFPRKSCQSSSPAPHIHNRPLQSCLQGDWPSADAEHHKGVILNFKDASSADDSS